MKKHKPSSKRGFIPLFTLMLLSIVIVGISSDVDSAGTEESEVRVSSIDLNENNLKMLPQDVYMLSATVLPNDATNKTVSWTSSPSGIVKLDYSGANNGSCTVTALKSGTATITATADGKSATCKVEVQTITVTPSKTSIMLVEGESWMLKANVTPSSANSYLKYSSSNTSIVSVDGSGWLNALKEGTATITMDVRGTKATCSVEVLGGSIYYYNDDKYGSLSVSIDAKYNVELKGDANRDDNKITGSIVASVSSDGVENGALKSETSAYLAKCIGVISGKADWIPVMVKIDYGPSKSMSLDAKVMTSISGAGSSLEMDSDNGGMILDAASVKNLAGKKISMSVARTDNTTNIDGAMMFKIDLKSNDKALNAVKGKAVFMLPLEKDKSSGPSDYQAYSVGADGKTTPVDTSYNAIAGTVSVTAQSWNTFAVTTSYENGVGSSSTLSYVAIAAIIIIAALCLFLCYRFLLM